MPPPNPALEAWAEWWRKLEGLRRGLGRSKGTFVSAALRAGAKAAIQDYFRNVRPGLVGLAFQADRVASYDEILQRLVRLAAGRNRKAGYVACLRELFDRRSSDEAALEIRASGGATQAAPRLITATEAAILDTLERLAPTIGLSYRQVLQDLADRDRVSYRGTAAEVREVVRELLDHLAPEEEVLKAGVQLEKGKTKLTMKQKAGYILKERGLGESARKPATSTVTALEEAIGALARSVYDRASVSAHIATTRREVLNVKGYADAVLADFLQIHR